MPIEPRAPQDSERADIKENIHAVLEFYAREDQNISRPQRFVEAFSLFIGQPRFFAIILGFVAAWMLANFAFRMLGYAEFDAPPYSWLQGILGLGALLTATAVLARQNRSSRQQERRAHLDLKVTLLTEQKAAKLIDLLEELRRDLPNVKDRHDPAAAVLQRPMNAHAVLAALDEHHDPTHGPGRTQDRQRASSER